jgi:hypothetical protein
MSGSANTGRLTSPAHLGWASADHHRRLTYFALGGLAVGGILAVTGPPPLDLHGPLHYLGIMDPLCGMTRGVLWTLRGRLDQVWAYNPASPLLVGGALAVLARAGVGLRTGRWLTMALDRSRRPWSWLLPALALVAVAALWANQQHHAALLMTR